MARQDRESLWGLRDKGLESEMRLGNTKLFHTIPIPFTEDGEHEQSSLGGRPPQARRAATAPWTSTTFF